MIKPEDGYDPVPVPDQRVVLVPGVDLEEAGEMVPAEVESVQVAKEKKLCLERTQHTTLFRSATGALLF